ncbi:MAG: XkdX family protein [Clostridia bacterium]|nr:XkdX family protein [Clostridia bacterium]
MHSPKFDKLKDYYARGLWNEARLQNAVAKGWITAAELLEIILAE